MLYASTYSQWLVSSWHIQFTNSISICWFDQERLKDAIKLSGWKNFAHLMILWCNRVIIRVPELFQPLGRVCYQLLVVSYVRIKKNLTLHGASDF